MRGLQQRLGSVNWGSVPMMPKGWHCAPHCRATAAQAQIAGDASSGGTLYAGMQQMTVPATPVRAGDVVHKSNTGASDRSQ